MNYRTIASFFVALFLLSTGATTAQDVSLREGYYARNEATRPGIRAYLSPNAKDVKKAFEDYMNDTYDVNLKGIGLFTNKDELYAKNVKLEEVSTQNMDIYAEVVEADDREGTRMTLYGALGYDIFLSEDAYPMEYRRLESVMTGFLRSYLTDYHEERLEEARENLEELTDDTQDLTADIDDREENIEDSRQKIEEMKREIEELTRDLKQREEALSSAEATYQKRMKELDQVKEELKDIDNQ
ncbi:MAG: hypothetical protein AAGG68_20615 [Bacteroidota bacterium]